MTNIIDVVTDPANSNKMFDVKVEAHVKELKDTKATVEPVVE